MSPKATTTSERDVVKEIRGLVAAPTVDSIQRLLELTRRPPTPNVRLLAIDGMRLKFAQGIASKTPGSAAAILDAATEILQLRDLQSEERELVDVLLTNAVKAITPLAIA